MSRRHSAPPPTRRYSRALLVLRSGTGAYHSSISSMAAMPPWPPCRPVQGVPFRSRSPEAAASLPPRVKTLREPVPMHHGARLQGRPVVVAPVLMISGSPGPTGSLQRRVQASPTTAGSTGRTIRLLSLPLFLSSERDTCVQVGAQHAWTGPRGPERCGSTASSASLTQIPWHHPLALRPQHLQIPQRPRE